MSGRSPRPADLEGEVELPQPRRSATRSSVGGCSPFAGLLELVDRCEGPTELCCGSGPLVGVAAGPGAASRSCVVVSFEEFGRVEAVVAGALGT